MSAPLIQTAAPGRCTSIRFACRFGRAYPQPRSALGAESRQRISLRSASILTDLVERSVGSMSQRQAAPPGTCSSVPGIREDEIKLGMSALNRGVRRWARTTQASEEPRLPLVHARIAVPRRSGCLSAVRRRTAGAQPIQSQPVASMTMPASGEPGLQREDTRRYAEQTDHVEAGSSGYPRIENRRRPSRGGAGRISSRRRPRASGCR